MQKVESSSLFIRFTERPAQAGLSRFLALLLGFSARALNASFRDRSGMEAPSGASRAAVEEGLRLVERASDEILEEIERVVGDVHHLLVDAERERRIGVAQWIQHAEADDRRFGEARRGVPGLDVRCQPIWSVCAVEVLDTFPAMSVARAVYVRAPRATLLNAFVQLPFIAATVPWEMPFSNTSTVVPDSAVPVSVKLVPGLADGAVMTGGFGARESTCTTRSALAAEVPPPLRALAVSRYASSAGTVMIRDQVPVRVAVVVPNEVPPSKISTVAPAWAVPETVKDRVRAQL